jgi:DNA-binding response OmpR family regulator
MRASIILIVDDESAGRDALEALLDNEGYQLVFAENGKQALQVAAEYLPDVILLDVMMPDMDGFEVCTHLRENPHLAEVPILMVTALDDDVSRLSGIQAGADDFISKPFKRAELRARLRTITRLNRYRRLNEERNKFQWITNNADDAYILTDADDKILYANQKALTYLALPPEEACLGHSLLPLLQQHYLCEPQASWRSWPQPAEQEDDATPANPRCLIRPETHNASPLWLDVASYQAEHGEHIVRLRDVTAQMTNQRSIHTFHSMLQHKLRTPLEPLVSGLNFILSSPDIDEDTRKEFIDMALHGAKQLHSEVNAVLDYLNAGKVISRSVYSGFDDIGKCSYQLAQELEIDDFTMTLDEQLQNEVTPINAKDLEWVMRELFSNAKKFHPEHKPQVSLELHKQDNKQFLLRVSDNGLTLSPAHIDKLWHPYYQAEKYFTGQVPGMGLGLSTIANLVWQAGGECQLHNRNPAPGVIVELSFPLAEPFEL